MLDVPVAVSGERTWCAQTYYTYYTYDTGKKTNKLTKNEKRQKQLMYKL